MASIARRRMFIAAALLAPALLQGQHHTLTVDKARKLLGGEFYLVPGLRIIKIEDVSYMCSTGCITAVWVVQEVRPNELIGITESRVPEGLTTAEVVTSPARFRASYNSFNQTRAFARSREVGDLVLRISGSLSSGRLAALLNGAVPLADKAPKVGSGGLQ